MKTSVSPRSSLLGTFQEEECLRLSGRNTILMTQINVPPHETSPVAKSEEKRMFLQASKLPAPGLCPPYYAMLLFCLFWLCVLFFGMTFHGNLKSGIGANLILLWYHFSSYWGRFGRALQIIHLNLSLGHKLLDWIWVVFFVSLNVGFPVFFHCFTVRQ